MKLLHDIPTVERARLLSAMWRGRRAAHGEFRLLRLRLCAVLVEAGRIATAAAWLRRCEKGPPDPTRAFVMECLAFVIDHGRFHGTASGQCISSADLVTRSARLPERLGACRERLLTVPAAEETLALCLEQYLRVVVCQLRRSRIELRAARAASDPSRRQAYTESWIPHGNQLIADLDATPRLQSVAALELASWYQASGDAARAERFLAFGAAVAPVQHRASIAWRAAVLRTDWMHGPNSSMATWNLHLRESVRESNELAQSLEAAEFGASGPAMIKAVDGAVATLAAACVLEVAPWAEPELDLQRAYAAALKREFALARSQAEAAEAGFERIGNAAGIDLSRCVCLLASIANGDLDQVAQRLAALIGARSAHDSDSWILGNLLLLSRWGRWLLTRRGAYGLGNACFAAAYQLARVARLPIQAAQSLVDLAAAEKLVGYRLLACARYRVAASAFLDDALMRADPGNVRLARVISTLMESALAYVFEADDEGVARARDDLALLIDARGDDDEASAGTPIGTEGVAHAKDRLMYLGAVLALAGVLKATRIGDRRLVIEQCTAASAALTSLPVGEAAYFAMQLALARNDKAAAIDAANQAAQLGFAGGSLAEIERFLATAPGELARNEHAIHLQMTCITRMKLYAAVRQYPQAYLELKSLERLSTQSWFEALPVYRVTGPADAARACLGAGDLEASRAHAARALRTYEDIEAQLGDDTRRLSLLRDPGVSDNYVIAAAATLGLDEVATAFGIADSGKARALRHLIASRVDDAAQTAAGQPAPAAEGRRTTAQEAVRALAAFRSTKQGASDLDPLWGADEQITGTAFLAKPSSRASTHRAERVQVSMRQASSLASVAAHCPQDTLILCFAYADDVFMSWAVDARGLQGCYRLTIEAREVNTWIREFLLGCRHPDRAPPQADRLGALFLAPHDSAIQSVKRIVIVPYGEAAQVPFHAFPVEPDGLPLGLTHVVSYTPAAACLHASHAAVAPAATSDVVLGALYEPGDAIGVEVDIVAASLGCRPIRTDELARDEVLSLMIKARRLHVAAHADHRALEPWDSRLLLCRNEAFTAADLSGLRFQAELVTLGACSTGAGAQTNSDPTGFARAFLAGGARTCVVSLWDVDSVATSALMEHFYRSVSAGNEPGAAMAHAQRLIRSGDETAHVLHGGHVRGETILAASASKRRLTAAWSHPHYWASFIVLEHRSP